MPNRRPVRPAYLLLAVPLLWAGLAKAQDPPPRKSSFSPVVPKEDFASVMRFIETIFDVPSLTDRDAQANDMMSAFNFHGAPQPPLLLTQRTCP